jgi:hypothetical protein
VSRLFGALRWLLHLLSFQRLTPPPPAAQQPPSPAPAATGAAPGSHRQQQQQQWVDTPELQVVRQRMHKSHTQGALQVRLLCLAGVRLVTRTPGVG